MKPSDFMIGLINFLSILLPGAIATTLLLHVSPELRELSDTLPQHDVFAWTAFFAAAYFAGHLIFLVGSWLDPVYDAVRRRRHPLPEKEPKDPVWFDPILDFLLKRRLPWVRKEPDQKFANSYTVVDTLRRDIMTEAEVAGTNSFQWSRALLIQNCSAAHKDIEVHEADQKFFRSLVILSFVLAAGAAIALEWVVAVIALAAMVASFVRYYNRRLKTVTLAYIHVLTLYRSGDLNFRPVRDEQDQP
ncbi:hypothetical protein [uncultured Erythrobacter sp.]|uniref:hypothetical protein n=1 Tax=uncultured Erythrobacter sp. TaxID=263913 RepID=UPI00261847BB|nr:hypothetical protein [uncultured Erythrobacter sp.]